VTSLSTIHISDTELPSSHINAVDKDSHGDYLVSSRHTSTIFKIAGLSSPSGTTPGTIIWRLGGKKSSFPTMDSTVPGTPNLLVLFTLQRKAYLADIVDIVGTSPSSIMRDGGHRSMGYLYGTMQTLTFCQPVP